MAHVSDLGFTIKDLADALDRGEVRMQTHPEFPELTIWNYTEETQFRKRWSNITLACRGLIINQRTGEVIARPWEKFFNFGEMNNRIDSFAPVEVTDKMDGSLGILYQEPGEHGNKGKWAIATRGSFASDQAEHATELLATKYREWIDVLDDYDADAVTMLFEIVYPENRIVCNYGDMDDLVFLGAVHKERGHYYGPSIAYSYGWPGPVTEVFHAKDFVSALSLPDRAGKEGYVIRSGRNIVKMKQADYVELHRIVTNLSPKTIWAMLKEGKTIAEICDGIPDEFHGYVEEHGNKILADYMDVKLDAMLVFRGINEQGISRKEFAARAVKQKNSGLLFALLDDRSIDEVVWKMVKPVSDKALITDEEE